MKRLPAASTARPRGQLSAAFVAGPPSPEKPSTPRPTTVVMIPSGLTWRTRWLSPSEMKRLPAPSSALKVGKRRRASAAGPPAPEKPTLPVPTTVDNSRAHLAHPAIVHVRDQDVASG